MKVLVCGGRDYRFKYRVWQMLDDIHQRRGPIEALVEGAAKGVDTFAAAWATERGIALLLEYQADWETHGRAAGPIRNQKMLDSEKPDLVVAFPGGRGTADMVRRARAAGVEVMEVAE